MPRSVEQPGFRVQTRIVATTLLDANEFTKDELAKLYRARWRGELDLRSLKQTLQMDVLRRKTPELVRKEIWTHMLAYNLIRTVMAQAAAKHGIEPRSLSFKGAVQTLEAFHPVIASQGDRAPTSRRQVYEQLLDAVAGHRVADRPDRYEPRLRKRRPRRGSSLCGKDRFVVLPVRVRHVRVRFPVRPDPPETDRRRRCHPFSGRLRFTRRLDSEDSCM